MGMIQSLSTSAVHLSHSTQRSESTVKCQLHWATWSTRLRLLLRMVGSMDTNMMNMMRCLTKVGFPQQSWCRLTPTWIGKARGGEKERMEDVQDEVDGVQQPLRMELSDHRNQHAPVEVATEAVMLLMVMKVPPVMARAAPRQSPPQRATPRVVQRQAVQRAVAEDGIPPAYDVPVSSSQVQKSVN